MMQASDSEKKQSFLNRHFKGIATAAIVLIPTIYTTLFLGSMWDPYGNVDQLPVAVVNQDQSVEYEGKMLDVGTELVEKLQENQQLDFHFVDAKKAESGLQNGSYYMVITIPSDFSENASTLLEEEPKKMQLEYRTNPGTNYIASKMSESALVKIEKEISKSVTEEYTETIFDQLGTVGIGMSGAADGALELQDGVTQVSDGNKTITDNLKLLSESTLTFADGAKNLEEGLRSYTEGVSTVHDGAGTLSKGMYQLANGAGTLADGVTALSDGTGSLASGVGDYTDGVAAAYHGAKTLSGSSEQLTSGVSSLSDGAEQLQQGSDAMTAGLQTLSDSLNTSLSSDRAVQLQQVTDGLTQIQTGIQTLYATLQQTELPDTDELTQILTASLTAIGASAQDAETQLDTMHTALTAMTQTEAFQSLDAMSQQQLLSCFSEPMNTLAGDVSEIGAQVTSLSGTLGNMDLSDSGDAMTQLKTSVGTLAAGADQVLPGAQQAIGTLSSGLQSVQRAVDDQLLPGAQQLSDGVAQLSSGSGALESGVSDYTGGVSALTSGLETLQNNTPILVEGATALQDGAQTLTGNLPTLTDAVTQLQDGAEQLSDGTAELIANNNQLCGGASALTSGAQAIQSGAAQLTDGSVALGDGLTTLSDGTATLQLALADGAEELAAVDANEQTYDMFAAPVQAKEAFETEVASNGNAMAAYMMAVGLWVAGLAFCVMLSPHDQKIQGRNAVRAWGLQLGKLWILAVIQALLMVGCLMLFNGFEPDYLGKTLLIACLSSIAFLTLEYCVNFFLGIIGSFILLVFMVLQLSGCAGTYPLELSNRFYQYLNPFMPFTYTVQGFRSGIASGQDITMDCIVLSVIVLVFAGLLLVGFQGRLKRQKEEVEQDTISGDIPIHA